jgi:predicted metalloendopeptidase
MSEATKRQALLKLHAVTNKIGYPDKWRDYSSIRDRARTILRATYIARRFLKGGGSWPRSASRWIGASGA